MVRTKHKAVVVLDIPGCECLHVTDSLLFLLLLLLLELLLVDLETSVVGVNHALHKRELLCRLCLSLLIFIREM